MGDCDMNFFYFVNENRIGCFLFAVTCLYFISSWVEVFKK